MSAFDPKLTLGSRPINDQSSPALAGHFLNNLVGVGRFGRKENAVPIPRHSGVDPKLALMRAYDEAWTLYEARCLWNIRRVAHPTMEEARNVARHLRQHGDMNARRLATRIESAAGAA